MIVLIDCGKKCMLPKLLGTDNKYIIDGIYYNTCINKLVETYIYKCK